MTFQHGKLQSPMIAHDGSYCQSSRLAFFFLFLFCGKACGANICSKQIFVLLIAVLFLFFVGIYSSMLQMLILLDVLERYGQTVVTHLIAVRICSLC